MKCPICNSELEEERYTEEICGSFDVVEIHQKCKRCKLYEYEYFYGNSYRWIYKKLIYDQKEHKAYIKLIRFLWRIGVVTNE